MFMTGVLCTVCGAQVYLTVTLWGGATLCIAKLKMDQVFTICYFRVDLASVFWEQGW